MPLQLSYDSTRQQNLNHSLSSKSHPQPEGRRTMPAQLTSPSSRDPHRGAAEPAPRRQRHPPPPPRADGDLGAPRAAAAAARGRARQQRARRHPDGPARRGLVPVLLPGRARRPQRGAPARVQVVLQVLDQGRAVRRAREGGSFSSGARAFAKMSLTDLEVLPSEGVGAGGDVDL